ncbi:V-type ATP synthase subunit E [Hutsoniella sourekii]|uniref:V-type ATP synthase subunit E n=1 Tax=Hutsoniella sourekii TaxID=87650 RepID=UPI0004844690|nr:V-type ATP synthase subunit E [Hutsoniella sourekii]
MSEYNQLKDSVLDQADRRGQVRLKQAQDKAENDYQEKRKQLLARKEEERRQLLGQIQADFDRQLQQLQNKKRQASLASKQELLDVLFTEAVQSMNSMSSDSQLKFIYQVLNKFKEFPISVTFGQYTKDLLSQEALDHLKINFPNLNLIDDVIKHMGGFIVSQDRVDYNYIYENMIADARQKLASQLSQSIFSE